MIRKFKIIYFIEFFWLLSLLILASMVYLNHELVDVFFNSDWVMFFKFIQDIFQAHGHYKDWVISPAPHFFPDMLVFAPFILLIKNIYFQFLVSIWIMIVLTYLAVKLIYFQFFSVKRTIIFALAATSSLFLLALSGKSPYVLALVPAVHVGEFIAGLFLIGIQIKLINSNKVDYKTKIFIFISLLISFFASLSDLLFIVQFAFPIFLTYSFFYVNKRINFSLGVIFSCSIMAVAILGGFLTKYLVPKDILLAYLNHPSILNITFKKTIIQLIFVIKLIKNINDLAIQSLIGIFYVGILYVIIINYTHFKNKLKIYVDKRINFIIVFIFSSILVNVISFFFSAAGNVLDRYFINFYYFPFLLFFLPLYYFKYYPFVYKIGTYLSCMLFLYILGSICTLLQKPQFKVKMGYYPIEVRCIDNALRGYGRNGISQFWDANYITSLSRRDIQIVPVNSDLTPFYWSINIKKFDNDISFIVVDNIILNKNIIYAKYGVPEKKVNCYTRELFIYPKDSIKLSHSTN